MVVATMASASSAQWSIVAPPEWKDVSTALRQQPQIQEQQKKLMAKGGAMELVGYQSPTGDSLFVIFTRAAASGRDAGRATRDFEAGAHESSIKLGSETSYMTREHNHTLIADQVIDASGRSFWMRRLTGVNDAYLLSVAATCTGPQGACASALQSLTLDSSGFHPLGINSGDIGGVDRESDAYKAGYAAGRVLVAVIIALLLLWLLVRLRRAKQSR